MSRYPMSNGMYIKKTTIDSNVRKAKAIKLDNQLEEHGYNFCETCKLNDCKPVTNAHIISVDECQKTGRAELAWDLDNIILEGIPCHQKRDGLDLKISSNG